MAETFNTADIAVTSTEQTLYTAPSGSGDVSIILSLRVTNIDGTNAADATITYNDQSNTRAIASTISVPADSALNVIDKNSSFYLEEGDSIEGGASAASDLVCLISYEILDDA